MIIGVLDFETTGTDPLQDRVIEVGKILYTTSQRRVLESEGFIVADPDVVSGLCPIPKEVSDLTGITNSAVKSRFAHDGKETLFGLINWLNGIDAVAGHNVNQFDWEVFQNWATRYAMKMRTPVLIDTMWDLPGVKGRKLKHMCADDGFLLDDAHEALTDCRGTLKLIEKRLGQLDQIVERAKSPLIVLQSLQDRDSNDQAKKREFHWNADRKVWWKACKEMDVEEIGKEAPFDVCIRRDLNLRALNE